MTMAVEGKLIEMNARMVVTGEAGATVIAGALLAAAFAIALLVIFMGNMKHRAVGIGICAAAVALGVGMAVVGANMPRVKEIRYCADGPVSLEQIVAVYKIVDIDGKEITVREK